MNRSILWWSTVLVLAGLLAGCGGLAGKGERQARQDLASVTSRYRPGGWKPDLPQLTSDDGLSHHLTYALLNSPHVEAAYHDWAASVERITVERSLPDPQLTFEADIADTVMTLMPGLMQVFPGPGKLKARGNLATAESQARYFAFESAVLDAAFDLKRAFYELHALDERIRISQLNEALLADLEWVARARYQAGQVPLQDLLRAQIERDRVATDLVNLRDSRQPKFAAFKAALGMTRDQPDPPVPAWLESSDPTLSDEQLLALAFRRNPRLKEVESEIRAMQADIALAYKENVPDFTLGVSTDVQPNPVVVRPEASMTLPIWRDKIAAGIARAKAQELAARSRLTAAQIALTVEFANRSFQYREATRNLTVLGETLLPKAQQSLELSRVSYSSGATDFINVLEAERSLLEFQLAEVDARTQHELVLAEISLLIAGLPPRSAPVLESSPDQTTHRKP
ncbi:MAG: TolC family protein [Verrucomicrobia bacterium]|jgi:outer membrane protein TolC|nr:TolC family protein [Verrucomicrobiota bacterium]